MDFSKLERQLGYTFRNKTLLKKALTLSSYDGQFNNQSLECLGDSILNFVVSEKYYLEGLSEGDITGMKRKLLSDKALTPISCRLGLADALIRGKGDCNNQKAVPSAYEAMAAAIYLDGGFGCAKRFVLATLDFKGAMSQKDYISALQEELQAHGIQPPKYEKVECGTPQKPWFVAKICVDGKYYEGDGGSFSLAKLNAAKSAYEQIKKG